MIVNGLGNTLSVLQGLNLLEHKVEVVLTGVKSSKSRFLTAITVVKMVVIKANDSGKVRNKGVGLPSTVVKSSSERSNNISSKDGSKTTHEGRLSTSRIGGYSNDDGGLTGLESHVEGGSALNIGTEGRHESRRGEGRSRGKKEGTGDKLHFLSISGPTSHLQSVSKVRDVLI